MTIRKRSLALSPEEVGQMFEKVSEYVKHSAFSVHRKGRRLNISVATINSEDGSLREISQDFARILKKADQSNFLNNLDINVTTKKDCCKKVLISFENDNILEGLYCKQGTLKWKLMRKNRITGSTCYGVFTFKKKEWATMLKNFFCKKDILTKTMAHGWHQEKFALSAFQENNPTYTVNTMGILICQRYPWLAYSPDGVIFDDGEITRLLEIKCPYLGKIKSVQDDVISGLPYLNNDGSLKETHSYYAQVQLGMALFNVTLCDFIVFCSKDQSYLHITIPFDENFANHLLSTISKKFFDNMLHYICLLKENI